MGKISNIRSLSGHDRNPFRKELLEQFEPVKKREYISQEGDKGVANIITSRDGEVVGESRFFRYKTYDSHQFAKVFTSRVTAMWDMPKPASRIFSYILTILVKDKDEIYFDANDAMKYTEYSSQGSIWQGVKWLLENDFIAKAHRTNVYYINPTIFFNGDRAAFVDLIIREDQPKAANPDQLSIFENKGEV